VLWYNIYWHYWKSTSKFVELSWLTVCLTCNIQTRDTFDSIVSQDIKILANSCLFS